MASAVPSPPSAIATVSISAIGRARPTPAAMQLPTSAAPNEPLNLSGAIRMRIGMRTSYARCRRLTILGKLFHRRAGAEEIAVAVDVVDPRHGRPEFVVARPARRDRRPARASRDGSSCRRHLLRGVRRVFEQIVFASAWPDPIASISPWMAIIASQKRSSSSFDSLSVGSTMIVPATGQETVGA